MSSLIEVIVIFFIGLAFGGVCGLARVPIPAPPTVAGVVGILGVTLGWILANYLMEGGK